MSITIQKIQDDKQKIITISLIVSDKFCDEIIPIFIQNKDLIYKSFDAYNQMVINWCIEFYEKYNKAPHQHIQDIFNSKKRSLQDDIRSLIKKLLLYLSDKYERDTNYNEAYVIDQAKLFIREVNLNELKKEINEAQKNGDIDKAEYLIMSYDKIDKETEKRQTTNILNDMDKIKEVCSFDLNKNKEDRLFKFRGDLGKDLGWIFREDFFIFCGFGKIGKSFHLRQSAYIPCFDYGLNVFIFNLEMSHNKYVRNFYQDIANEIKYREKKEIKIPFFNKRDDQYFIDNTFLNKKGLDIKVVENKIKLTKIKTKGNIIVESFPSNTLTFQKCVKILDDYLLQGIVCDVLLIDYLDNMKSYYKGDYRHGLDDKWVNIRRLAQEKHISVGSVTHTNTSTLKGDVEPGKLAEENRKYNHVTHAIGINQLPHEKRQQYSRLNIIANRDEDFDIKKFYISLECRDIGKVMIDTKNMRDVILDDEEEE